MIYESNTYSSRVNDAMVLSNILLKINSIIYDKDILFLVFKNEQDVINVVTKSFIKELDLLENTNKDKTREQILKLYSQNKSYFENTFSVNISEVDKLNNNKEKADLLLKNIIKNIYNLELFTTFISFNNVFFQNAIDCPIIVEEREKIANKYDLNNKSITSNFILDVDTKFSATKQIYYYDSDYIFNNQQLMKNGFHLEKYVVFDFDLKRFEELIPASNKFGNLLKTNLNLSIFLSDNTTKNRNIVVNPQIFKKIFAFQITDNNSLDSELQLVIQNFPSFISNLRVGSRLISRIVTNETQQSIETIYAADSFKKINKVNEINFPKATFDIIKNKSFLFISDVDDQIKKHKHILISKAESDPFNFTNFNIIKVHEFIDKTIITSKFDNLYQIFDKLIPLEEINTLSKLSSVASRQNTINSYLSGDVIPPDNLVNFVQSAKIINEAIKSSLDQIVINKGY